MSKYFVGLNYGLANEDTKIEYDLLRPNLESIFSVCGSGSRVIPLIAKHPQQLHVVDLSETQLMFFRLRYAAMKRLDYQQFLYFLGYTNQAARHPSRTDLMARLDLSSNDLSYWKENQSFWKNAGFIFLGKWERHFMRLGKVFQLLSFSDLTPVFAAGSVEEQKKILHHWKPSLFKLYTKVVMNEKVANRLLYKGAFAGGKNRKTSKLSAAEVVHQEFDDLFQHTHVRKNFFLTMILENELPYPEGYPLEADESIFNEVKKSETKLSYYRENLLSLLRKRPYDFYSLSDTFSYMADEEVRTFLAELPAGIREGATMVIRTFMRKPSFAIDQPWVTDEGQNKRLAQADCTRMYELTVLKKSY